MLAVLISAVNIIGGVVVSQRMLNSFRKPGVKDYSWFIVLPGIAISELITYDSEWEEIVGTNSVSEQLERSFPCTLLTVDVSLE